MFVSAEISHMSPELIFPSFHVFSIGCSKASKASALKDFTVMKVLSSFEIAFESLDTNAAFRVWNLESVFQVSEEMLW